MKLRLQPIRVLCFHQVSEAFDATTMHPEDWIQIDEFKRRLLSYRQQGYIFISLPDAHRHIKSDYIRCRKYMVLTSDDGWASLNNILPWLSERQIPITLFLNPAYLDGRHFREKETEKYLTAEDVCQLHKKYPLLTVGSHGWKHIPATKQTKEEFRDNVARAVEYLQRLPNFIPYHAYTWGWTWIDTNEILWSMNLTPVNLSGMNYDDADIIHREPFGKGK